MPTRKRLSTPPDMNGNDGESVPGIHPPAGVEANVSTTIRYKRPVTPDDEQPQGRYREPLDDLASEEIGPTDPLTNWVEVWQNYTAGYNLNILRLPDPPQRRIPGQTYRRPYYGYQPENIGIISFEPNLMSLLPGIQAQNGDSGGVFQLWLSDMYGQRVPESILYSVSIADPLASQRQQPLQQQQQQPMYLPAPQAPPRSETELDLERLKNDLFRRMLEKALEQPAPQINPAQLPGEDQAALFLMKNTNFLTTMFEKMADMTKTAEAAPALDWKSKMADAAVNLAVTNPAILQTVSSIIERIVAMIMQPRGPQYIPPPQPVQESPQIPQRVNQQPTQQPAPQLRAVQPPIVETGDNLDDEMVDEEITDEEMTDEDITVEIIEDIARLLNSDDVLSLDHPICKRLQVLYPRHYEAVIQTIPMVSLDQAIEYIKAKSEIAESLLNSSTSGPRLRIRLAELQELCKNAKATTPPPAA